MGSLHNELLAQAWHLAKKEPKHPLQASLRRAVSAAYYTLIPLMTQPLEPQLRDVARTFVDLQQARHDADYDRSVTFIRTDVLQKIALANSAFSNWKAIHSNQNARVFLAALLLQRHWRQQ